MAWKEVGVGTVLTNMDTWAGPARLVIGPDAESGWRWTLVRLHISPTDRSGFVLATGRKASVGEAIHSALLVAFPDEPSAKRVRLDGKETGDFVPGERDGGVHPRRAQFP